MKDRFFIRGKTTEEKFRFLEKVLKHFSKRLSRKVIGLIPSAPVFRFTFVPEANGTIMRIVFPAKGKISKSCVYVSDHGGNEKSTTLYVSILRAGNEQRFDFEIKKVPLVFNLDRDIEEGDRVIISVKEGSQARGIWIGFLYNINVDVLSNKEFMLEQLEMLEEEDARET